VTPSRSENLKIELLDSPKGARVIQLTGPMTLRDVFDFQEIARQDHVKPVIVDIAGTPYMDSAGLGAIIGIYAACQRTGRGFGIVGVAPRIQTLFQVTGCAGMLPCFDSIEAADAAVVKR
jgi:anti-sigma B factor antagonist